LILLSDVSTGQMEPTLLQSFIKAGKLRRWLARPDCPPAIQECKILFDKAYAPKCRDDTVVGGGDDVFVEATDDDDPTPSPITVPDDLRPLLKGMKVSLRARLQHHRVIYARSSTHLGNSLIHFYPHGDRTKSPIPGSIKYIFLRDGRWAFAVQRHLAVGDGILDPFSFYVDFPAKLYSPALTDTLEVIEVSWVMSHFARWQISSDAVVVLSLSRVRVFPPYALFLLTLQ
jgi:hypothetical protein